jgi:hypothetical protein
MVAAVAQVLVVVGRLVEPELCSQAGHMEQQQQQELVMPVNIVSLLF